MTWVITIVREQPLPSQVLTRGNTLLDTEHVLLQGLAGPHHTAQTNTGPIYFICKTKRKQAAPPQVPPLPLSKDKVDPLWPLINVFDYAIH